ncbi:MAG: hypothetical protein GY835_05710 [bacterium]|nr:hypothetical protein [bacterium]
MYSGKKSFIMNVKGDFDEVLKEMDFVEKKVIKPATRAALNKALAKMSTQAVRGVSEKAKIKQKSVRSRIRLGKAKRGKLWIMIGFKKKPTTAIREGRRQTRKGVTAGKHRFQGAFITSPKSQPGNRQIFSRIQWQYVMRNINGVMRRRQKLAVMKNPFAIEAEILTRHLVNKKAPSILRNEFKAQIKWRMNHPR